MMDVGLYLRTIRSLQVRQIVGQLTVRVRCWIDRKLPFLYRKPFFRHSESLVVLLDPFFESKQRLYSQHPPAVDLVGLALAGRWFDSRFDLFWWFYLHSFNFWVQLEAAQLEIVMLDWLDHVPRTSEGWHPFPTSLRLCNWVWSYSQYGEQWQASTRLRVQSAIHEQAAWLRSRMEYHILGNHLLENCKGLVVAGVFLNQKEWVSHGLAVLSAELEAQILPDGGHYERSPMYHSLVLEAVIACYEACAAYNKNSEAEKLRRVISRMAQFLDQVSVDGRFPLLNDSAYATTVFVDDLLAYCRGVGMPIHPETRVASLLSDSGYFVYKTPEVYVCFDGGPLGPDFLCGHGHNDGLSFILKLNGQDVITDSGTYSYHELPWRQYFRSVRAHSAPMINNQEPNEIWSKFRVGYRGKMHPMVWDAQEKVVTAGHDCYAPIGVRVVRCVKFLPDGIELTDWFDSKDAGVPWKVFFQLAPEIQVQLPKVEGGRLIGLSHPKNGRWHLVVPDTVSVDCVEGLESWEFGAKQTRNVIILSGSLPQGRVNVVTQIRSGDFE